MPTRKWSWLVLAISGFLALIMGGGSTSGAEADSTSSTARTLVLEDFHKPDNQKFPEGWEAQRSLETAKRTYTLHQEGGTGYLTAKDANQRVYMRTAWDPKAFPVMTWRWRLKEAHKEAEVLAAVYISLDTDLLLIPVSTKYVWSATKPKGTVTEGGLFGATEIVLRSGREPVGEWVEERVNAYEEFKRIHGHEPAPEAWGISLLGGSGVEVDFGSIRASAQ
ncbi:MAG: DUF3047 domain-containing protein [Nitrospirales bacterium]